MEKRISILLYEDTAAFAEMVGKILSSKPENYWLKEWYRNTRFLMRDMLRHQPDVVLMDIRMEREKEGLEALCLIKNNFPATKVIILTDFAHNENIFDAFCLRADGFLDKKAFADKIEEAIADVRNGTVFINSSIAQRMQELFPEITDFSSHSIDPDLTPREREVLNWLAKGYSYKMTAAKLGTGEAGVMTHVRNMYGKLGVHSATEAVYRGHQKGLLRLLNRPFDHWIENATLHFRQTAYTRFGTESRVVLSCTFPTTNLPIPTEVEDQMLDFIDEQVSGCPKDASRIMLDISFTRMIGTSGQIQIALSAMPGGPLGQKLLQFS
jgi:DNA-binding NarL/FixJ family response regulator